MGRRFHEPTEFQTVRYAILLALAACDGSWAGAARRLDVDPSNLHKLARRLGIK